MRLTPNIKLMVFLVSISVAVGLSAQTCTPPREFVDTPHPAIAPSEQLVSHTEEITIDRPLTVVLAGLD
ncbi:MAG TPA: hypothetical protein VHT28_09820, partial [Silvibacterium sp.]|nr:hypothetical protein [Silvibacterium sp.]